MNPSLCQELIWFYYYLLNIKVHVPLASHAINGMDA